MIAALCTALLAGGWQRSLIICAIAACGIAAALLVLFEGKLTAAALGLLAGAIWCGGFVCLSYEPALHLVGTHGELTMQVLEYPKSATPEVLCVRILDAEGKAASAKAKLYLEEALPDVKPGDVIVCTGTLTKGDSRLSSGWVQKGYFLTASQEGTLTLQPDGSLTLLCSARRLGREIQNRIRQLLPGDSGNLLAAMLSGDRSLCSEALQSGLVNSGTAHLAAVSGLHLSIVVGFFVALLGKRGGFALALPVIVVYAAVAGCSPSTIRAVLMQALFMLGLFLHREYDPMTALFGALLVLTIQNPFSVLSASLLLSFAATFGILLFSPMLTALLRRHLPKQRWLSRPLHWIGGTAAVSFAAMILTLPLNLIFFGRASLLSVLSNLLVLWTVGLAIVLGLLLAGVSAVSMPAAAMLAAWVVRWPMEYLVWIIRKLGSLTLAVGAAGGFFLELGAVAAICFLLAERWSKHRRGIGVLTACFALSLCFLLGSIEAAGQIQLRIYGNYGAPVLLIRDGTQTMAVGAGSSGKRSASQIRETLEEWNRTELTALVCLTDTGKSQGALSAVAERTPPAQILVPEGENAYYQGLQDHVLCFGKAGVLRLPGAASQMELIPLVDGIYAMRWVSNHLTILALYGEQPLQAAVALEAYTGALSADILLTDGSTVCATHAIESICSRVRPGLIVAADSGYEWIPQNILNIPVVGTTETGAITLRIKR